MSKWHNEKRIVLEAGQRMAEKGLVVGTSGNVSLRLPREDGRDLLAITPSRRYYGSMTVDDIQVVDFEAEPVEGDLVPSAETMLHIGIYRARQNIRAVIHTHSTFASVISVAGIKEVPPILDDQVVFVGGEIAVAGHAMPGSQELTEHVVAALGERNGVILPNHGVVGIGRTMDEAFTVCELVERAARVYVFALALGKVHPLPQEAVEIGKAYFAMLHGGEG
jgi:L-fuculose-phosphate aldolase